MSAPKNHSSIALHCGYCRLIPTGYEPGYIELPASLLRNIEALPSSQNGRQNRKNHFLDVHLPQAERLRKLSNIESQHAVMSDHISSMESMY